MSKLPAIKPRVMIRALERVGFVIDHQTGSHVILFRTTDHKRVVVPVHNRDLGTGLLLKILADAGLTRTEFEQLL